MSFIIFEIVLILILVAANGVFAMSEMALVSSRKTRLQQLANGGDASAAAALKLAESPDRFLSTVQIGITLIGILAGAFGGARIASQLALLIGAYEPLAPYADGIALGLVVVAITFLSLIFGELVPKRLALNSPERIASFVARPMNLLSKVAAPFVYVLSVSSQAVFKLFGFRAAQEAPVTEEEIKVLISQGTQAGIFERAEEDLVKSVFRLGDRRISALMTPRLDVVWLDAALPPETLRRAVIENNYSRFPVCEGSLDNVIGVIKAKDFLALDAAEEPQLKAVLKQPLYVPESRTALQTLDLFKRSHTHVALIINEHGAVEGLVTTNDILEAIVGEVVPPADPQELYAVRRDDGSWLLDGALPVDEFREIFTLERAEEEQRGVYQTLAGFVLFRLGRVPVEGDKFEWDGLTLEVVDMDGNRIDKILVAPLKPDSPKSI